MYSNKDLAMELHKHVIDLSNKDSALNDAVFWELVYDDVSDKIEDDLTKMFVINEFMANKKLGGLRVIRDHNKPNNEGDYYTITGAQHIISIKVPELVVSGLVSKQPVNYEAENGVKFSDRINILDRFCKSKGLNVKKAKEFKAYLIENLKVEQAVSSILSVEAIEAAKDYVLRHKICFQAKWNGLDAVKSLLN